MFWYNAITIKYIGTYDVFKLNFFLTDFKKEEILNSTVFYFITMIKY